MSNAALAAIWRARAEGLRPDTLLTVSQWADAHRRLPKKSSAEPGPWRTARTPYLREIMDAMSSTSDVEEVVLMKAAQIGGSEVILNTLGYVIDHSPGPTILVQPTVELAKRFSKQRAEPLITATPRLTGKIAPARSRDSGNTVLSKEFPGGLVIMTGANSAVGLRSMPAQYALLDEIDGYPVDVDEEGSPIALVEARQRTFSRRKRIKVSTPTIGGRSAIEAAYDASDQRRYYVPCPHCTTMQPLTFAGLRWPKTPERPDLAVYVCQTCGCEIESHHKTDMLARGEWRAEAPDRIGKTRGYHINALYAPVGWMSWGDIAKQFVETHRDPDKYRVFINTVLGEVWQVRGEAPEWEALMKRREAYAFGTVPAGALFLTAGCDVQKDRIVVEVVGWGRGKCSWSIEYSVLPGETSDLETGPWRQLDELLARMFPHAQGVDMPIRMLAIDSGYNTQIVMAWSKNYAMNRVIAVKGTPASVLVGSPAPVEVHMSGKKMKHGGRVWPVGSGIAKSELYGWLRLTKVPNQEDPPGYCHFPEYAEQYFKELTAEHLLTHKSRKGYIKLDWEQIPGRENHVLDARVYARCAAALAGLDRFRESDWAALEKSLGISAPARPTVPPPTSAPAAVSGPTAPVVPVRQPWMPRRQGRWLRG